MSTSAILITGASGFIGGAIGHRLVAERFKVTGVSRRPIESSTFPTRVTDYSIDAVARLVSELRPVALIHAAGPASVADSIADPNADFCGSVLLFQRVLEGIRRSGERPRVVYPSSAAIYGNPESLPIPENARPRPISPYGHHKMACETLAAEYASCFDVPSLVLRIFSVFGPAQRRLLVWDLFRKLRDEAQVVLDGSGEEARDYLHIEDLASQVASALRVVSERSVVLNVASGRSKTVRELAQLVARLLGSSKSISFTGRRRTGDPREWRADMSKYESLCGARVALDFERRLAQALHQWRA